VFPLIKLSLGLGVLAIAIVLVAFFPLNRLQASATIVMVAVVTFAVGWFGTGNGFENFVAYVKTAFPIVTGYSAAMVIGPAGIGWRGWLAVVVVLIVGALTWLSCRRLPPVAGIGVALCAIVTLWLLAKEAFVRFDGGHEVAFFAFLPILVVAFRPTAARMWVMGGLAVAIATSYTLIGAIPILAYRPDQSVRHFGGEVLAFATSGIRHQILSEGRSVMQATYSVPPSMLSRMRGHTVYVDPWEENVTWAYPGSTFDPLPVFQDYSAYTTSLDDLDASFLSSSRAPSIILKEGPLAIDGRSATFEPPLAQVVIECRYRQVSASTSWQLLVRGADRCGAIHHLSSVVTDSSGFVRVPTAGPGGEVLATFELPRSPIAKIEELLTRSPEVCMNTKWVGGTHFPFRFVVGTATDVHLLRPATTLGYDPPFVPPNINSFNFSICGSTAPIPGVRVTFYRMAIRP
ncbi:MAG: hypothetical protein ACRDTS_19090, partial [Mycobacterium sp.]